MDLRSTEKNSGQAHDTYTKRQIVEKEWQGLY
jgi:hypothetical protein